MSAKRSNTDFVNFLELLNRLLYGIADFVDDPATSKMTPALLKVVERETNVLLEETKFRKDCRSVIRNISKVRSFFREGRRVDFRCFAKILMRFGKNKIEKGPLEATKSKLQNSTKTKTSTDSTNQRYLPFSIKFNLNPSKRKTNGCNKAGKT